MKLYQVAIGKEGMSVRVVINVREQAIGIMLPVKYLGDMVDWQTLNEEVGHV